MTTFDKREEGFEKKFAHDEELLFKANARRNKLLGLWAAEKLGLSGDAANVYAKEVVMSDFEEAERTRAHKRSWLAERDYRVVEVKRSDVERDVASVLDVIAAAIPGAP